MKFTFKKLTSLYFVEKQPVLLLFKEKNVCMSAIVMH